MNDIETLQNDVAVTTKNKIETNSPDINDAIKMLEELDANIDVELLIFQQLERAALMIDNARDAIRRAENHIADGSEPNPNEDFSAITTAQIRGDLNLARIDKSKPAFDMRPDSEPHKESTRWRDFVTSDRLQDGFGHIGKS